MNRYSQAIMAFENAARIDSGFAKALCNLGTPVVQERLKLWQTCQAILNCL